MIVRRILGPSGTLFFLAAVLWGCSNAPRPEPVSVPEQAPSQGRALPAQYHLQVGDEISILILDQPTLGGTVKVRPDGKISAPGTGEIQAAGRTLGEVTASVRSSLRRILRYPDVSLMLTDYADQLVYVFGEVEVPGAHSYVPNMTALHALGAAAGVTTRAKLGSVLVLRRSGPTELEVYRIDLADAVHGRPEARDLFLQPYDVVFIPRTLIAEINIFVDQFIRQNIAPFTAYIQGWRAFHMSDIHTYQVQ